MQNKHDCILKAINRKNKTCDIMTAPTHERYSTGMSALNHKFWMMQDPGFVKWKTHQTPIPNNHILLEGPKSKVPNNVIFDLILSQNRFGQYQHFKPLAEHLGLPMVQLEHTIAPKEWSKAQHAAIKEMRGDLNVFISEYSVDKWGFTLDDPTVRILHHGVDTDLFSPGHDYVNRQLNSSVTTIANDYIGRDYFLGFGLYKQLTEGLATFPVGDTKGFSKPAESIEQLISFYRQAGVFLNTSQVSPIPMSLLEAASCACPIVSTYTCAIPCYFKDGVHGIFNNDPAILRDGLKWCLENPEEAKKMGQRAREHMVSNFGLDKFVAGWEKIIQEAVELI